MIISESKLVMFYGCKYIEERFIKWRYYSGKDICGR